MRQLENRSIDFAVGRLAIVVDVPGRDSAVARGPESRRRVIAFTNVLKLSGSGPFVVDGHSEGPRKLGLS